MSVGTYFFWQIFFLADRIENMCWHIFHICWRIFHICWRIFHINTIIIMSRSIWKGPYTECFKYKKQNNRIWSRRSMILPAHLGKQFMVHNGKHFISVNPLEEMCSRKFGEFAATRKKTGHKLNRRKQLHKKVKIR